VGKINRQDKVLAVLDLFSKSRPLWTSDELMQELGYTRPTLYRYLKSLKDCGPLMSTRGDRLTLGPRVVEMDYLSRRADPLAAACLPHLTQLTDTHPSTALIVRWYGDKMLCVASQSSTPNPVSSYPLGRPMPMGRGAIARSIMAFLPKQQLMPLIARNAEDLRGVGLGKTAEDVLSVLQAHQASRRRGRVWRSNSRSDRHCRAHS